MFNLHYNYCPRSYKNLLMTFCAKYWWGTKLKVIFQLFGKINAVCQINKVGNNDSWKLVQAFYGHELVRKIRCTLILYKFLCLWIFPEDNYVEHYFVSVFMVMNFSGSYVVSVCIVMNMSGRFVVRWFFISEKCYKPLLKCYIGGLQPIEIAAHTGVRWPLLFAIVSWAWCMFTRINKTGTILYILFLFLKNYLLRFWWLAIDDYSSMLFLLYNI